VDFEEFDLLVLGAVAGGFARLSLPSGEIRSDLSGNRAAWTDRTCAGGVLAFAALGVMGLVRGLAEADPQSIGWFDDYAGAANSVRVSKSLLFASALWPLMNIDLQRSPAHSIQRLGRGMQVGLGVVGLAVLWERLAYPGLLDFSARYRTIAAFWEMHIGGAAIDVYLAIATPFAAWALVSAKSRRGWAAAAALALLTGHACLTTFSRGAYVGVLAPLVLLGAAWRWRPLSSEPRPRARRVLCNVVWACGSTAMLVAAFIALGYSGIALTLLLLLGLIALTQIRHSMQWRRAAALALTLALVTEVVAVVGGGDFMRSRLDASERDFGARLAHWQHGLSLLGSSANWLLGVGAGRLPARYARDVPRGEFSGALKLVTAPSGTHAVELSGPATVDDFAGLFSLTQRIALQRGNAYRVALRARVALPTTIALDVCEQHLLYPRQCQGALVRVTPDQGGWQSILVSLDGPELDPGHWYAPRLGLFSASIRDSGTAAEFAAITLIAPDGTQLLANTDFSAGLAHWFPAAEAHFLPWHIDNFYLEVLIEHGAVGLAALLLLLVLAFRNLFRLWRREVRVAPFLAASLLGALVVGCVSSFLDVPRISFLFLLIATMSLHQQISERSAAAA
jgi:hypothetical protein